MTLILIVVTFVLMMLGAPIFVVIASLTALLYTASGIDLSAIVIEMHRMATTPVLVAIPLFTFAGYCLSESAAPRRLIRLSNALLGWLPGGLSIIALLTCAVFTALTGATGLTIIALGGLLLPAMRAGNYPQPFSLGLLTTSGTLIIYAIVGGVRIDQLFIAGIIPGILLVGMLSGYCMFRAVGARVPRSPFQPVEIYRAVREGIWELPLPLIVLGGIYSGYFAVSEAAAITAVYVLGVETLIYKDIPWSRVPEIMKKSMVLVGTIFIIFGAAMSLTNYLIDEMIPMRLLAFFQHHIENRYLFLIVLNLFLLAAGCTMGIFSALVVVVPLLAPMAEAFGIHPIHLGVIFLTNLEIGASLPPLGINLFIASIRFSRPVLQLYAASIPFLLILLLALVLITYFPWFSLVMIP